MLPPAPPCHHVRAPLPLQDIAAPSLRQRASGLTSALDPRLPAVAQQQIPGPLPGTATHRCTTSRLVRSPVLSKIVVRFGREVESNGWTNAPPLRTFFESGRQSTVNHVFTHFAPRCTSLVHNAHATHVSTTHPTQIVDCSCTVHTTSFARWGSDFGNPGTLGGNANAHATPQASPWGFHRPRAYTRFA